MFQKQCIDKTGKSARPHLPAIIRKAISYFERDARKVPQMRPFFDAAKQISVYDYLDFDEIFACPSEREI